MEVVSQIIFMQFNVASRLSSLSVLVIWHHSLSFGKFLSFINSFLQTKLFFHNIFVQTNSSLTSNELNKLDIARENTSAHYYVKYWCRLKVNSRNYWSRLWNVHSRFELPENSYSTSTAMTLICLQHRQENTNFLPCTPSIPSVYLPCCPPVSVLHLPVVLLLFAILVTSSLSFILPCFSPSPPYSFASYWRRSGIN